MVLSAGLGRRLQPLTWSVPKPAVPTLGRPMILQILHRLACQGVERAVVNLHHLPERVARLVGDGDSAGLPEIEISFEPKILGTAGGIARAAGKLRGDGPILVCNGDTLADVDLAALLETHLGSGLPVTLVLVPHREGYGAVEVDDRGRVLSLAGEPPADPARVAATRLFAGAQLIDESVLDRIPPKFPCDLVRDLYRPLAREGRIGSHLHEGFWWEFGSPELYLEGSLRLLELPEQRRREIAEHDPVREWDGARVALGPGVFVDPRARLRGHAAIGFACHVGEHAEIEDSVVMPESWVGPGCRLKRAVVAPGVELPAGFRAEQSMVCPDARPAPPLPPATRRVGELLVYAFRHSGAGDP